MEIRRRSNPSAVRFVDHPELDFDLPDQMGSSIKFPFDNPPAQTFTFSSLNDVHLLDDPSGITATYTGVC
jgi:hypothetical protein